MRFSLKKKKKTKKRSGTLESATEVLGRNGVEHKLNQLHTRSVITSPEPCSSGGSGRFQERDGTGLPFR